MDTASTDMPISDDQSHHHEIDINVGEHAFEVTRNPVFAWKVAQSCNTFGYPLPASVAVYQSQVVDTLIAQARRPPTEVDKAVRIAVFGQTRKRGGPGSAYSDYYRDWARMKFTCEIEEKISDFHIQEIVADGSEKLVATDYGVNDAIEECAIKYGLGFETAKKAYYKWRKILAPLTLIGNGCHQPGRCLQSQSVKPLR